MLEATARSNFCLRRCASCASLSPASSSTGSPSASRAGPRYGIADGGGAVGTGPRERPSLPSAIGEGSEGTREGVRGVGGMS